MPVFSTLPMMASIVLAQPVFLQQLNPDIGPYNLPVRGGHFELADMNGDGHLDVVKQYFGPYLVTMLSDGSGNFSPGFEWYEVFGQERLDEFLTTDLDKDGDTDVVILIEDVSGGVPVGNSFIVVTLINDGNGTLSTRDRITLPDYDARTFITSGDFNGDGWIDLGIAGRESLNGPVNGFAGVLLNDESGHLGPYLPISVISSASYVPGNAVVAGDMNMDGLDDLIVGVDTCDCPPDGDAAIVVLLSQGDGTFVEASMFQTLERGVALVGLLDIDQDHDLDLAIVLYRDAPQTDNPTTLNLLENDGNGVLGIPVAGLEYPTGFHSQAMSIADVNADGINDVVLGSVASEASGRDLSVSFGTGVGSLAPIRHYKAGNNVVTDLEVGDLNRDGLQDVISASDRGLIPVQNLGDGTFPEAQSVQPGGVIDLIDLNGDGRDDLLAIEVVFDGFDYIRHLEVGISTGDSVVWRDRISTNFDTHVLGDFDGDGNIDVVVQKDEDSPGGDQYLMYYENDGSGLFDPIHRSDFTNDAFNIKIAIDLDQDGDLDIVGGGDDANNDLAIKFFLNDGEGRFTDGVMHSYPDAAPGAIFNHFFRGDFNNDDLMDFLAQRTDDGMSRLYLGQGGLSYSELALPGPFYVMSVGDVTGDGTLDLMTTSDLLVGLGDGSFTAFPSAPPTTNTRLLDIDGDGDLDYAGWRTSGQLDIHLRIATVFFNQGDGTYTKPDGTIDYVSIGLGPYDRPVFGDLDADGDSDIVYPGSGGSRLLFNEAASGVPCPADLTEPFGVLDIFDLLAYLALFEQQDSAADLNGDAIFDIFDLLAYLGLFEQGCP